MHEDKRSFKCIVYVLISRVCNRPKEKIQILKCSAFTLHTYFEYMFNLNDLWNTLQQDLLDSLIFLLISV